MPVSPPTTPAPRLATLPDGEQIVLRDVRAGDERILHELLEHVTGASRWMRFFCGGADIDRAAALEAHADGVRTLGVLALSVDGRVLGHGMCVPTQGEAAEVAFEVVDGQHRRGIGGVLLEHLVQRARAVGYRILVAEVLPSNRDMRDMLAASGLPMTQGADDGVVHFSIPIDPTADRRIGGPEAEAAHV